MPRPKTVSDQDVISAALLLLEQKGSAFTLSDIARSVNLSRATLIQRFGNREGVLLHMAREHVAATEEWLRTLSADPQFDDLTTFLHHIVDAMGSGADISTHVAIAAIEAREPALKELAGKRYALVQQAIADRLEGDDRLTRARAIHAVIAGVSMQWVAGQFDEDLPSAIRRNLGLILPTVN